MRYLKREARRRKELRAQRTPAQRRVDNMRCRQWRIRNFAKSKLPVKDREDQTERRHAATVSFLAGHEHTCVRCPKKYPCTNACDPVGEGLNNSICPGCLLEVQFL